MLKDYVDLKPGDYVIQNGANSAVGQVCMVLKSTKSLFICRQIEKWIFSDIPD